MPTFINMMQIWYNYFNTIVNVGNSLTQNVRLLHSYLLVERCLMQIWDHIFHVRVLAELLCHSEFYQHCISSVGRTRWMTAAGFFAVSFQQSITYCEVDGVVHTQDGYQEPSVAFYTSRPFYEFLPVAQLCSGAASQILL